MDLNGFKKIILKFQYLISILTVTNNVCEVRVLRKRCFNIFLLFCEIIFSSRRYIELSYIALDILIYAHSHRVIMIIEFFSPALFLTTQCLFYFYLYLYRCRGGRWSPWNCFCITLRAIIWNIFQRSRLPVSNLGPHASKFCVLID